VYTFSIANSAQAENRRLTSCPELAMKYNWELIVAESGCGQTKTVKTFIYVPMMLS